jgi:hypothetical protein
MHARLSRRDATPAVLRAELAAVPPQDRDAWLDLVLGLVEIPDDSAALPRGCVPYLPSPVDKLTQIAEHANVQPTDVFVDVGSGVGRAVVAMHLVTGSAPIVCRSSKVTRRSRVAA